MLHREVAAMLLPDPAALQVDVEEVLLVDYATYVHSPAVVGDKIQTIMRGRAANTDAALIDFTANTGGVRDPLLCALAASFSDRPPGDRVTRYVVLLPELPGDKAASTNAFRSAVNGSSAAIEVVLIGRDGEVMEFGRDADIRSRFVADRYRDLVSAVFGDPAVRMDRKTVRRLGHFRRTPQYGTKCSASSYHVTNSDREFDILLRQWWEAHASGCSYILYDLAAHHDLRDVVEAFAAEHSIGADRIQDFFLHESVRSATLAAGGQATLIVDAVESGGTLLDFHQKLNEAGVNVGRDVLTVINKSGSRRSHVGDFTIHGLVGRPGDPSTTNCLQCHLRLPFTPESFEPYLRMRSYDILSMAQEVGWAAEPEKEVPHASGGQYTLLPNFTKLLERHGDWIAFKFLQFITGTHSPDDWHLVLPDEQDSSAIAQAIQRLLDDPVSVTKLPRSAITQAQDSEGRWDVHDEDVAPIVQRLRRSKGAAYLLDIFNGSGGTLTAMVSLLSECHVDPKGYLCLVDLDPVEERASSTGIAKFALYEWYYPRPEY